MSTGFVVRYIFNIPEAAISFSTRSYLILSLSFSLSLLSFLHDTCNYKSEPPVLRAWLLPVR